MISLSNVIWQVKSALGLASGVKIIVAKANGQVVHGRTKIVPSDLDEVLGTDTLDMRVADFCKRFARCIGAQIGATVRIEFAGQVIDGRRALKTLTYT
jgi:hypothetical protein